MTSRLAVLAVLLLGSLGAQPADETPVARAVAARSTVHYVTDTRALVNGFTPSTPVVQAMVDGLVAAVTRKPSVEAAWRSLVSPKDVVGIKVAAAPGAMAGTHVAVVRAIARGLQTAGIPPDRIVVWDRNREDLRAAGFSERDPDFRLQWLDPASPLLGYDREAQITAPVLGKLIWGDSKFGDRKSARIADLLAGGDQLSSTSYFAAVLSRQVTKVINVPSLCDSFQTGLNGALANMTLWNVDNWRRFVREPYFGNPYIAEIYADPVVRDKVVLTILDALALQFAGGPQPNPNFTRQAFTLYASTDPVAIDAVAIALVDEYRKANRMPLIKDVAGHVESAAAAGIGNSAMDAIDQVRVGTPEPRAAR